jgi:hypothetical protein
MIIDCGTCAVAGPACGDCVVSVLLGIPEVVDRATSTGVTVAGDMLSEMPESSVLPLMHVEDEHAAALEVLAGSGLVPPLRLVPRSQAS